LRTLRAAAIKKYGKKKKTAAAENQRETCKGGVIRRVKASEGREIIYKISYGSNSST